MITYTRHRPGSSSEHPPFEIPKPPALRTLRRSKVAPRVPLQIFGWAFKMSDLAEWATENGIGLDEDKHHKQQLGIDRIAEKLPDCYVRVANVYDEESIDTHYVMRACLVLGSNQTAEDLQRTQDIMLIEQYRCVLGPNAQLKWHKFARD